MLWWRVKRSHYDRQKGEGNKQALQALVNSGPAPGILAYLGPEASAWCAIAPREAYPVLERSRVLQRVDDQPVWSIVCLFVAKPFRRQGLSVQLIKAAVQYAQQQGARVIEAYPVEPKTADMPAVFASTGLAAAYRRAGFVEALRRSETRPIMRFGPEEAKD